ncbi:MAG TPA: hypothetical protein VKU41_18825 [Polyangiaceae bacterium]|nr:hypothetical protein [Polyangiaceae bacterium]
MRSAIDACWFLATSAVGAIAVSLAACAGSTGAPTSNPMLAGAVGAGEPDGAATQPAGSGGSSALDAGAGDAGAGGGTVGHDGGSGGGYAGAEGGGASGPASCSAAAGAYSIHATTLDANLVPVQVPNFWGGTGTPDMRAMVAVDASQSVYVGVNKQNGSSYDAVIAAEGSAPANMVTLSGAILGGLATTKDGLGALLYDPTTVDQRLWAQVKRLTPAGQVVFSTDLFRSANLTDDMTKGNPARGRLGYLGTTDELVAYFGHMQMLQGVRHQGGYLAKLSPSGTQTVLSGWFGSHNLDQRLVVDGSRASVLGLGDAYPVGFFFSFIDMPNTNVIYTVAADGEGDANGQVGGMFPLSDVLVASFVTDRSIAQNLSAGTWPNIDQSVAMKITQGAISGTDAGFLLIAKSGAPAGNLTPVWVKLSPASGATIAYVKSVQYGSGDLILFAWAEVTGSAFAPTVSYYKMVVDRTGAICQPKKMLDANDGLSYDDVVRRSDGSIVWANGQGGMVHVVTLTP